MSIFFIILLTLIFSAFFSGMEIAFISANKFTIELENKQGLLSSKIIARFLKHPSKYISTMLIGNNISLVIYGIFMAQLLEPWIQNTITKEGLAVPIIQTIISTLVILIPGEFLPKMIFRVHPNAILKFFAPITLVIYQILAPFVHIVLHISNYVIHRILKLKYHEDQPVFGRVDLDNYLNDIISNTKKEEELEPEIQLFRNALDFSTVRLRECMLPRTEIIAVEVREPIAELEKLFINTQLSRIMIFKDHIDNLIGYVECKQLFKNPARIDAIVNHVLIVPETMLASNLLEIFLKERKNIAVVVDEFGGTSGIVTIEDIVEEIVGDIEDEHDEQVLLENKISEHEFIFAARLDIDYINQKYDLNIPESEDYKTLAGFIIHNNESIPKLKDEILFGNYQFTIIEVSETKIEKVKLTIIDD